MRVPNYLKRSLTSMQITQFLIGGSGAAIHLFIKYNAGAGYVKCLSNTAQELAVVINCVYLTPLTWLFVRFFIRSYITGRGGKRGGKVEGKGKGKVEGKDRVEGGSKVEGEVEGISSGVNVAEGEGARGRR